MKDINDCTIDELQNRIDELKCAKRDKELSAAKEIVENINRLISNVNGLGFVINTYDGEGYNIRVDCIVYENEFGAFTVKGE